MQHSRPSRPGRFGERRNASASMVHASHAAYAAPAEWIEGTLDAPELRSAKRPLELFRAEAVRDRLAAIIPPHASVMETASATPGRSAYAKARKPLGRRF